MTVWCPRPDKFPFESKAAAHGALRRMARWRKRHLHVYPCVCGRWHLGRQLKRAAVAWRGDN